MKVTFELEYDEAYELRRKLLLNPFDGLPELDGLAEALDEAMQGEDERRWTEVQQRLMESGGVDDSAYRRDMKDAGRRHLLR